LSVCSSSAEPCSLCSTAGTAAALHGSGQSATRAFRPTAHPSVSTPSNPSVGTLSPSTALPSAPSLSTPRPSPRRRHHESRIPTNAAACFGQLADAFTLSQIPRSSATSPNMQARQQCPNPTALLNARMNSIARAIWAA
jgi:hypothetical protein